jgi:hypothetical protein
MQGRPAQSVVSGPEAAGPQAAGARRHRVTAAGELTDEGSERLFSVADDWVAVGQQQHVEVQI